jgi:long-chain fatty acid transport protein
MVFKRSLIAASVAATIFTAGASHATNGYFSHGFGVKSIGMGGSGVALPNDSAMIMATNPAGITETGTQINFDVSWFHPVRGYDQTGVPASANSNSNNFYIPEFSTSYAINDTSSVGIAVYGNGGLNTDYSPTAPSLATGQPAGAFATAPGTGGEGGVNLKQMFIAPTYAHKFMNGKLSVGASLLFARQTIQVKGLDGFGSFSTDRSRLTSNNVDSSTGWGGKIGVLYHATDALALGGSYQTKMAMSRFSDYSGLFSNGGKFDIPATWTVGAAFQVAPAWTLTADYQRINYANVAAIGNPSTAYLLGNGMPGNSCARDDTTKCLGGSNGAGFGWSNVSVIKLGAQWQFSPALQLRAGFNHGTNPVGSQDVVFNALAPGVMKNHFTAGFTYAIDKHQEISGAFMYAPTVTVTGSNTIPAALTQGALVPATTTSIHMKQYEATVGYAYKF